MKILLFLVSVTLYLQVAWNKECNSTLPAFIPNFESGCKEYFHCIGTENIPFTCPKSQFFDFYRNGCYQDSSSECNGTIFYNMAEHMIEVEKLKKKLYKVLGLINAMNELYNQNSNLPDDKNLYFNHIDYIKTIIDIYLPLFPIYFKNEMALAINNLDDKFKDIIDSWKRNSYTDKKAVFVCMEKFSNSIRPFVKFVKFLIKIPLTPEIKYQILNANYDSVLNGDFTGTSYSPSVKKILRPLAVIILDVKKNTKNMIYLPTIADMHEDAETVKDLRSIYEITKYCFCSTTPLQEQNKTAKEIFITQSDPILLKIFNKYFSVIFARIVDFVQLIIIDIMNLENSNSSFISPLKQLIFDFMTKHSYIFFPDYTSAIRIYNPLEIKQDSKPIVKILREIFMDKMSNEPSLFLYKDSFIHALLPTMFDYQVYK